MTEEDEEFQRIEREQQYKLDSTRSTVVADDYYWIPIDQDTPTGMKVLLLGRDCLWTMPSQPARRTAMGTPTEEENMSAKRPGEPLNVFYSIKLTQSQRIKLLQLGGPEWIRNQIERSTKLPSLGESNAGQVRPGQLHQDAAAGRGD